MEAQIQKKRADSNTRLRKRPFYEGIMGNKISYENSKSGSVLSGLGNFRFEGSGRQKVHAVVFQFKQNENPQQ